MPDRYVPYGRQQIEDDDVAGELVVRDLCDALDEREAFLGRQAGSPNASAMRVQGIRMNRAVR